MKDPNKMHFYWWEPRYDNRWTGGRWDKDTQDNTIIDTIENEWCKLYYKEKPLLFRTTKSGQQLDPYKFFENKK